MKKFNVVWESFSGKEVLLGSFNSKEEASEFKKGLSVDKKRFSSVVSA